MDRKPRILVVEDEDNIAVALDYLMTVMLPAASGYEICEGIRMDPSLADVTVRMMTARGSAIERRKGLALGADGFISKPFELKDLRDEVRRLLTAPV